MGLSSGATGAAHRAMTAGTTVRATHRAVRAAHGAMVWAGAEMTGRTGTEQTA